MHGVLLSRSKLSSKFDFRSISPSETTIFENLKTMPKNVMLNKQKNFIKIVKNRQKAIRDLKIQLDNKDQLQRIFKLGTDLFELRHLKSKTKC